MKSADLKTGLRFWFSNSIYGYCFFQFCSFLSSFCAKAAAKTEPQDYLTSSRNPFPALKVGKNAA